jgi:hypothetical protein
MRLEGPILILLASVFSLLPSHANAGSASGTINYLIVRDSDGLVYVHLSGTPTGRPACASTSTYWIIPNETNDSGKRLYALLLAAKASGQTVTIVGTNTCVRWHDGEDINYVVAS